LPDTRWRTDRAHRTSGGFAPSQGYHCLYRSLTRSLRGNAKGFALSFPKVVPEMAMLLIAAEIALWFFIRSIPILNWQETRLVYVQGAA